MQSDKETMMLLTGNSSLTAACSLVQAHAVSDPMVAPFRKHVPSEILAKIFIGTQSDCVEDGMQEVLDKINGSRRWQRLVSRLCTHWTSRFEERCKGRRCFIGNY